MTARIAAMIIALSTQCLFVTGSWAQAQCGFVSPTVIKPGETFACPNPSLAPRPVYPPLKRNGEIVTVGRGVLAVGAAYGGGAIVKGVGRETVEMAGASHIANLEALPVIGHELGEIPVVGKVIVGPPPPWLVGAVAIDTFVLPKASTKGYTDSALFTQSDFNSAPRLLNYVNYLAPMAYTHPPVYEPGVPGITFPDRNIDTQAPKQVLTPSVAIDY